MKPNKTVGYAAVASEYYDPDRHPTCRNFRSASAAFIRPRLRSTPHTGISVEIGAGLSLLGEFAQEGDFTFDQLLLVDSAIEMISHSMQFQHIATLMVADALQLPLASQSVSLMVCSLGDPYNLPAFWQEAGRCLRKGGICLVTLPSYEWASNFRTATAQEKNGLAYFELASGRAAYLPSYVWSDAVQKEMFARANLKVLQRVGITLDQIPKPHSGKIHCCDEVVTGFFVEAC